MHFFVGVGRGCRGNGHGLVVECQTLDQQVLGLYPASAMPGNYARLRRGDTNVHAHSMF